MAATMKTATSPYRQPQTEPNANSIHFLDKDVTLAPASGISEGKKRRPPMKAVRFPVFRALLLITFTTAYLCFLYGQERHSVSIVRNAAWNDLVRQMDPLTDDSPQETLGKEIVLIQKFLKEHQFEVSVGIYDIAVFRAIDQARARLQKADKDLETIRNELSYKEHQASGGR